MGNTMESNLTPEEVSRHLKPGLTISDLKNIKKAFLILDKTNTGLISYDIQKIEDIKNIKGLVFDHENKHNVFINYDQFVEIMTKNILKNREKYGTENIVFESETSNVSCVICPYRKNEEYEISINK